MDLYEVFMCGCRRYKVPGGTVTEPCTLHNLSPEDEEGGQE